MTIKTINTVHDDDWKNVKKDYSLLQNDKDISKRMDLLIRFFRKFKPQKILDIGCGSGYLGYLIKKIDSDTIITGFDISKHALGQAKSYDKAYFLDIDKENIPEEDNYFDMVVCGDVLEHIYDIDHCLGEIKRVLKPGGKAVVTTPNFSYWKYRIASFLGGIPNILKDPRHIHTFNLDFLSTKCYTTDVEITYSIKEKKGILFKILEKIFNKTVVLVLTKKNHE